MKNLHSLLLFAVVASSEVLGQSWVQKSTFPDSYYPDKRQAGVYVTIGTKAYVGLGKIISNGFNFLGDFWQYDILNNKWTKLPDYPGQDRYDAIAFAIGDNIYVGGGDIQLKYAEDEYGSYKKDFYVFNTMTKVWSPIPDMPTVRGEAAAFAVNGKGYVVCGAGVPSLDGGTGRDVYCYDPATSTWSKKADFPGAARAYPVGFAIGNKGYVGGGYKGFWFLSQGIHPTFYRDFYEYDAVNDQWTARADINNSVDASGIMYWGASVAGDCEAYVISPQTTQDPYAPTSKAVIAYNAGSNTWSARQPYPVSLIQGAAWYANGSLYAGLGVSSKIYSLSLKSIAGDFYICTSKTFTIDNTSNYPVVWTKSNNLSIATSSNTSITVSRYLSYKGPGWIQATLQDGCPTRLTKYVQVGPETADFSIYSSPSCGSTGDVIDLVAQINSVNYSWTVNGGTLLGGQSTQAIYARMDGQTMAVHCYVTGTSASNCYGPEGISSVYIYSCYGFTSVSTSPNPATESFDVELVGNISESDPVEIQIRNHFGVLIKSEVFQGAHFSISARELDNGVYFMRVRHKDELLNHRVIIHR